MKTEQEQIKASKRKIIVAVTGASGSVYARLLCERLLSAPSVERIALIMTDNGRKVMEFEDSTQWTQNARIQIFDNRDMFAAVASGSADYDTMVIVPCSMGMCARIANGISNCLVSRAADVMLKQRRRLVLAVREMPLSSIHLRNMASLSADGAVICPASPSFYSKPQTTNDLLMTVVEKLESVIEIELPHYKWGENN